MSISRERWTRNLPPFNRAAGFYFIMNCFFLTISSTSCGRSEDVLMDDTVLKINSTEVSVAEYMLFLEQEKALTYNYFYKKYGAQKTDSFWRTNFSGENPAIFIKEKANRKLLHVKAIQEFASKVKLTNSFDYAGFLEDWKSDNQKRKERHDSGLVVYGPIETSKKEYYNYLFTNLELKLKDKLNSSVFVPAEKELKKHFNKIRASHFSFIDTLATEQLALGYQTKSDRLENLTLAKEVVKKSTEKVSFDSIAKKHPQANYVKKQYLAAVQLYGEENIDRELKEIASKLKFDQIGIFDSNQEIKDSLYLVKLLKPIKRSIRNFEEVEKEVLYFYQVKKYEHLVDSLIQGSVLIKNQKIYRRLAEF